MKTLSVLLAAVLAGCATPSTSPLTATHPASPDAPEGARLARDPALREDALTGRSRALLSAAQREQEHWDKYGPVSGTPEEAPKAAPETKP